MPISDKKSILSFDMNWAKPLYRATTIWSILSIPNKPFTVENCISCINRNMANIRNILALEKLISIDICCQLKVVYVPCLVLCYESILYWIYRFLLTAFRPHKRKCITCIFGTSFLHNWPPPKHSKTHHHEFSSLWAFAFYFWLRYVFYSFYNMSDSTYCLLLP